MTEKTPVAKKRRFKAFLKIIALPVFVGVIAIAINHNAVLSAIDKKYETFLIWKHTWFRGMDATIIRPVFLDKKGVIFDEILEPRWESSYSLLFVANKIGAPVEWSNHLLPDDLYADLLVEIDQIDKDGSTKRIINHRSNHQVQNMISGQREIMASWNLPGGSDATVFRSTGISISFKRGRKYHIRLINQSVNQDMLNKPYAYNITLTNLNVPK